MNCETCNSRVDPGRICRTCYSAAKQAEGEARGDRLALAVRRDAIQVATDAYLRAGGRIQGLAIGESGNPTGLTLTKAAANFRDGVEVANGRKKKFGKPGVKTGPGRPKQC